jgi:hypothetical protein
VLVRVALLLTAALLALAAGLGSAALVERGKATWQSVAVVRLDVGPDAAAPADQLLGAGATRYLRQVATPAFTATAAQVGGVAGAAVRRDVTARQTAPQLLDLTAYAATSRQAAALAAGASQAFVQAVTGDQAGTVAVPGDRLTATVLAAATLTARIAPKRRDAELAGAAAAAVVLGLAVGGTLLVRRRRT